MKTTRRGLFGMLAGLFAGVWAVKQTPVWLTANQRKYLTAYPRLLCWVRFRSRAEGGGFDFDDGVLWYGWSAEPDVRDGICPIYGPTRITPEPKMKPKHLRSYSTPTTRFLSGTQAATIWERYVAAFPLGVHWS